MADLDLAGIITRVCQKLRQKFSPIDHEHGNINATGVIANTTAVSNSDSIIIGQYMGNKVAKSNIQFGTSQTTFLANNGTWRTPASSVTPSTTSPAMDGTAAVGISTAYARADHVHPTDTSRQATLVSGTNIKTINGNSLLGSGDLTVGGGLPTVTTADNGKVLQVVNGAWAASSLPSASGVSF